MSHSAVTLGGGWLAGCTRNFLLYKTTRHCLWLPLLSLPYTFSRPRSLFLSCSSFHFSISLLLFLTLSHFLSCSSLHFLTFSLALPYTFSFPCSLFLQLSIFLSCSSLHFLSSSLSSLNFLIISMQKLSNILIIYLFFLLCLDPDSKQIIPDQDLGKSSGLP